MLDYTIRWIKTTFDPRWWLMFTPYNKDIDDWLNNAMKHYDIDLKQSYIGADRKLYEIMIDGKIIWVTNHPYNSMVYRSVDYELFGIKLTSDKCEIGRPSRVTIHKFAEKVREFAKKNELKCLL